MPQASVPMSSSEPDATSMSCLDLWTNKVRVTLLHPPALLNGNACTSLNRPVRLISMSV